MSTDQIGQPLVAQLPAERIRPKILGQLMPISEKPSRKSAGFSEQSFRNMRQFLSSFSIRSALRSELTWSHYRHLMRAENLGAPAWYLSSPIRGALRPELVWTDYRILMRAEKSDAGAWYLKEAANQNWSIQRSGAGIWHSANLATVCCKKLARKRNRHSPWQKSHQHDRV